MTKIEWQVSMAMKMATVEKAEELLEKLRSASWNAAVEGHSLVIFFPTKTLTISRLHNRMFFYMQTWRTSKFSPRVKVLLKPMI